jgi:hypothetical protein
MHASVIPIRFTAKCNLDTSVEVKEMGLDGFLCSAEYSVVDDIQISRLFHTRMAIANVLINLMTAQKLR